jgi:hypothetical protein
MNSRTALRTLLLTSLLALLASAGTAAADRPLLRDEAITADGFAAEADRIEQAMAAGAWPRLGPGERADISASLGRIATLLAEGGPGHADLVRNEQVRINSLLAPALTASNRSDVVCRRVRPVGSNIPTTVCHRRAALESHSRDVQNELINQADFGIGGPSIDERNSTIQGRGYGRD